jgi:RNA polymerase sigma-70 factor (ECF subfamily)
MSGKNENNGDQGESPDVSFESLIHRARDGEQEAAGELIENYRNYLLLIANQEIDSAIRPKTGASDVVQESMMHAQMHLDQFMGDSEVEFRAWIRAILGNDIRKGRRKYSTRKRSAGMEVNIQENSAIGRQLIDGQPTPHTTALRDEKQTALLEAMKTLPDEQQTIIQLRNFDRLPFADIGMKMDRSADAARKFWARSIEALKDVLRQTNPELAGPREDGQQEP